jgi:hypothetical protein
MELRTRPQIGTFKQSKQGCQNCAEVDINHFRLKSLRTCSVGAE